MNVPFETSLQECICSLHEYTRDLLHPALFWFRWISKSQIGWSPQNIVLFQYHSQALRCCMLNVSRFWTLHLNISAAGRLTKLWLVWIGPGCFWVWSSKLCLFGFLFLHFQTHAPTAIERHTAFMWRCLRPWQTGVPQKSNKIHLYPG